MLVKVWIGFSCLLPGVAQWPPQSTSNSNQAVYPVLSCCRGVNTLFPPDAEGMEAVFELGFNDCKQYLDDAGVAAAAASVAP